MKNKGIIITLLLFLLSLITIPLTIEAKKTDIKDKEITINHTKERLRAGTYFVEIKTDNDLNQTMSEVVRMHVKYPKTELNYESEEGIDAHDVVVLTGTFDKNNKKKLISEADARAWSLDTGLEIKELYVDVNDPLKHSGTVALAKFSTKNNTSVDINVFEQDVIPLQLDELYMNQYSIVTNRLRTLSTLIITMAVFPSVILLIVFKGISSRSKKIQDLLDDE